MHQETSGSLAFIARRQGQADRPGAGQSAPARRPVSHADGLLLRLAGDDASVGGDGTQVEGRGRPACMGPRSLPPAHLVLIPLSLCFVINQSTHSLLLPAREEEVGPAGLVLGQKFSKFFL